MNGSTTGGEVTERATGDVGLPKSDYIEYPKSLAPDDFWGQVRRTVNGQAVGQDQILMIVTAIRSGLALTPADVLLDLACGNGALSSYLFDSCRQLEGVDHSEYLVEVARNNFRRLPDYDFLVGDAAGYVAGAPGPERFTKALCYGSFSFFSESDAVQVLSGLRRRFSGLERVYLGNLPDRDRAGLFYGPRTDFGGELDDHRAQIGIWRSPDQLAELAGACGWTIRVSRMPPTYYAHHYRYDAILERCS